MKEKLPENILLETLNKINDTLDYIKESQLDTGIITICQTGKECQYRKLFQTHTLCDSVVPCQGATNHRYIIYRSR